MNEKQQLVLFLITNDASHLPEGYPVVDIKKWLKKSDLQRTREAKRVISSLIEELKTI